ncbi:DUF4350 domain-containing protein [Nocardioides speluncae]|uniref:DUF4350 domain-containing protein n=1 Tax=Nocardioides speluncae TaxID=2670337 RepID=UPI000D690F4D|nr:DUF4350 domain-containing protein [Nocardioides speluncae]
MSTSWVRRNRALLLVGGVLLLAVALTVVLGGGPARSDAPLDPDNPGPDGAQAIARVLDDQGVEVTVTRSADGLEDTVVDDGTMVLVSDPSALGESTTERLLEHADGEPVVVLTPSPLLIDELGLDSTVNSASIPERVEARCDDPRFTDLTLEVDLGVAYTGDDGCFGTGDGSLLVTGENGVTLVGSTDLLTNDRITDGDNAAAALRLLGERERLVWYVPNYEDLLAEDSVSLRSLLPDWIVPALVIVALATIGLIWWRARRLGALVTEPLPVVVKAIETTRSRGRLYRKVNDRAHAAEALRDAAGARLADRLHLPRAGHEQQLVRDVARHTGRPEEQVAALLTPAGGIPTSDHELVRLANDLAALDREVRRS